METPPPPPHKKKGQDQFKTVKKNSVKFKLNSSHAIKKKQKKNET